MRKEYIICILLFLQGFLSFLVAQDPVIQEVRDSSFLEPKPSDKMVEIQKSDTVAWITNEKIDKKSDKKAVAVKDTLIFNKEEFKPDSKKAVIYSAIFPGLGQIYNRKYWKLPIIYGGIIGLSYAITWNGSKYNDYSSAYKDIMTGGDAWRDIFPNRNILESQREEYKSRIKRQRDYFRQNRDLAIIVAVGVYALCMIDAYVDAQLYDFDISPDLSMKVEPVFMGPTQFSKASVGLRCSINF